MPQYRLTVNGVASSVDAWDPQMPLLDIELIDRRNEALLGAGEAASSPVPAALANAVFDATGVRLRTVPFTAQRVKAALG